MTCYMFFMDQLAKNFSKSLRDHIDSYPRGYIAKLANELDVEPGTVSNWANGNRMGSESQRRKVADHIGIRYEIMIGIEYDEDVEGKDDSTSIFSKQIKKFKRKDKCLLAISNLQEMEKLDRTTFFRVVTEIEDMTCRLKEKKEKNQILSEPFIKENGNNINESRIKSLLPESDPELENSI